MNDQHSEFGPSMRQIDREVASCAAKQPQGNKYAITLGALVASAWVGETQQVQVQPTSELWLGNSDLIVPDGDGE